MDSCVAAVSQFVFCAVLFCLGVFAGPFLFNPPPRGAGRKRDKASWWGVLLQGAAFIALVVMARTPFTPIAEMSCAAEIGLGVLTVALAAGSVAFMLWAKRVLAEQWSLEARVTKDHKLITAGPYRYVRHPIYTGLFGLLISLGLAVSRPAAFAPALVAYLAGTAIRARSEERLMREAFGDEYEAYARRVPPSLLPGLF